jgi:hypothetical protein
MAFGFALIRRHDDYQPYSLAFSAVGPFIFSGLRHKSDGALR